MKAAGDMLPEHTLIQILNEHGVFKLGKYTLKSGQVSPIYIDLRVLISSPKILRMAADCLADKVREENLKFDYVVGVPYAALPIATLVSEGLDVPMLMRRKEAKTYGTKKLIEGHFDVGKKALIIEDVVTSGASILETVRVLRQEGLLVEDVLCVLDREQGGPTQLKAGGTTLHSVLTMNKILDFLIEIGRITAAGKADILYQLSLPIPDAAVNGIKATNGSSISYGPEWSLTNRAESTRSALNKRLFDIMNKKKTCLCLAVDYTKCDDVLKMVKMASDYVCAIKLHVDILEDFNNEFIHKLTTIANNSNFIIFEDRKLADTGNTVELQITKGMFSLASWVDIVTIHALPGHSILAALKKVVGRQETKLAGCLLVAELSTEGALTDSKDYLDGAVKMAMENSDIVSGFICQKRCAKDPSFVYWTPGVNMDCSSDNAGQKWRTIDKAIGEDGNDIVIVGRAITAASDVNTQLRRYRDVAWEALINRGNSH